MASNGKTVETEEQKQAREAVVKIAENLVSLAESVQSLIKGPLNKRALVVLLANSSGESQRSVDAVLTSLVDLRKDWINK